MPWKRYLLIWKIELSPKTSTRIFIATKSLIKNSCFLPQKNELINMTENVWEKSSRKFFCSYLWLHVSPIIPPLRITYILYLKNWNKKKLLPRKRWWYPTIKLKQLMGHPFMTSTKNNQFFDTPTPTIRKNEQ